MAYRDDLDGLAHQCAREDEQAALLAEFRRGERSRGRRAIAAWIGGLAVVGAIYGGALASPVVHRARHAASPQSIVGRVAEDFEYAVAKQRARVREAMQAYLSALDSGFADIPAATQGVTPFNPSDYDLDQLAAPAPAPR
jgi:hypothetical protein